MLINICEGSMNFLTDHNDEVIQKFRFLIVAQSNQNTSISNHMMVNDHYIMVSNI